MTNEEILKKAIEKAVKNGWDVFNYRRDFEAVWSVVYPTLIIQNVDVDGNCLKIDNYRLYEIIFSHDFAKAFWNEGKVLEMYYVDGQIIERYDWQYHLQQLVLEENPIKYLEKFL